MRRLQAASLLLLATLVAACDASEAPEAGSPTATSGPTSGTATPADPEPTPSDPASPSEEPGASASSSPVPTTLDQDVFSGYGRIQRGISPWRLARCEPGPPAGEVTAMGTAQRPFRDSDATAVRQVAVYATAPAAAREVDRLRRSAQTCADDATGVVSSATSVEDLPVGAGGFLLDAPVVDGGEAVALLRRGTAVALVGADGVFAAGNGLGPVVTRGARDVYQQLCGYQRGQTC